MKNAVFGTVTPDNYYHPPLITDAFLPNGRLFYNQGASYSLFCSNRPISNYRIFMFVLFSCIYLFLLVLTL
jgi:hypothetical protein